MNEQILSKLEEIRKLTLIGVKNVLDIYEASVYTGLSVDRLRHLASPKVNEISCSRVGKSLSFLKTDLDSYRMSNKTTCRGELDRQANDYISNH